MYFECDSIGSLFSYANDSFFSVRVHNFRTQFMRVLNFKRIFSFYIYFVPPTISFYYRFVYIVETCFHPKIIVQIHNFLIFEIF